MHSLERLYLNGTNISDDGLSSLSNLTNLGYVTFALTQINGEGLTHLSRLKKIWRYCACCFRTACWLTQPSLPPNNKPFCWIVETRQNGEWLHDLCSIQTVLPIGRRSCTRMPATYSERVSGSCSYLLSGTISRRYRVVKPSRVSWCEWRRGRPREIAGSSNLSIHGQRGHL